MPILKALKQNIARFQNICNKKTQLVYNENGIVYFKMVMLNSIVLMAIGYSSS